MPRTTGMWLLALAVMLAAGCNGSTGTDGKPQVQSDGLSPDKAVKVFLEAVRTGDDEKAALMLTQLAREETSKIGMVVAPPGSETAAFEVGDTEMLPNEIAHVSSTWSDEGEDHEIIWALRKEPEGWRIAGMATKIFADLDPVLLTFEDPEDMMAQQQAIEEEMLRRAQEAEQGDQPDQEAAVTNDAESDPADEPAEEETRQATRPQPKGGESQRPTGKKPR